jgi:hypothetical protein
MDQGFPDGDFPGGSPTELQRRVAEGAEPRSILEELWQTMQARLYGYGCKRLGDTSQADDFEELDHLADLRQASHRSGRKRPAGPIW